MNEKSHWVWNPDRALEGVFCPKCDVWIDDYYGLPDKCPKCGVELDGWRDIDDLNNNYLKGDVKIDICRLRLRDYY